MSPPTSHLLDDFPLDILGQQARINHLYTSLTFCFPLPDDSESTREEIIETLEQGLDRLAASFPWTAGQVICDENGVFRIIKTAASTSASSSSTSAQAAQPQPRLVVKDLSNDPSMAPWHTLQENEFPFRLLDEEVLAPCQTQVDADANLPVFLLQANFVQGGGFLLTVSGQHGAMDMTGLAQVITLLAKGMRGEVYSRQEIEEGNATRKGRVPLPAGGGGVVVDDVALPQRAPAAAADDAQQEATSIDTEQQHTDNQTARHQEPLTWAHIAFSDKHLTNGVKRHALKEIKSRQDFISRDDALTALMWQAISRTWEESYKSKDHENNHDASVPSSPPPTTTTTATTKTTLRRVVDMRRRLGLPPTYPGFFATSITHTGTLHEIAHERTLGSLAYELRAALKDTEELKHSLQVQAAAITQNRDAVDKENIAARSAQSGAGASPVLEVKVSSWAKEKLYDVDFGLFLGKPEAIRRPFSGTSGVAREGLVYFLPETRGYPRGEIVVALCLREGDMLRLKERAKIASWGRWIG